MSPIGWRKAFVLSSLALGAAFALACSLDTEGQLSPDASLGGSGGAGDGGVDVDTPDIDIPDGCVWPNKTCGGKCVAYDDPAYGCGQDTCDPCPGAPHTQYGCVNNECVVVGCDPGFYSCNGDPTDGCEVDIWSLGNCGTDYEACGKPCAPGNTEVASCDQGQCNIVKCVDLFDDCNDNPNDGCETNLRDVHNCAECYEECIVDPGLEPTCGAGVCRPNNCPDDREDCDSNPATCETDITTVDNCGSCGLKCSGPNVKTWACALVGGARTCQVVECNSGWGHCDGDHANGCELDLLSSVANCGQCGAGCSDANTQGLACSNGQCVPTCVNGSADCNGPQPGNGDDGCETNTRTPSDCGACGDICNPDHAVPNCSTGVCGIGSCLSGWGDCNNNPADGCETPLTSLTNCGQCGVPCDIPNAGESCATGSCQSTGCATGFADCNTSVPGCETNILTTTAHCGGCNKACSSNHVPSPVCTGGSCTGTCQADWGDCNGNKLTDGCERSLLTTSDCGACGTQCTGLYAIWTCDSATKKCQVADCDPGRGDCDGIDTNGCEINTNTNPDECGTCDIVCSDVNGTGVCAAGTCDTICVSGYDDCTTAPGCETSITTTSNCGACGNICSTVNGTASCVDQKCEIACSSDYRDCTTAAGCETNITTTSNCGTCGNVCSSVNGTPSCTGGTCSITCSDGYDDCTTSAGCETNTDTSVTNCGACGYVCADHVPANATFDACLDGNCEYTCSSADWTDCDNNEANGCECPTSGFVCVTNACRCQNNPSCGTSGTCNASGLCVCGSNTCAVGEICVSANTCGANG